MIKNLFRKISLFLRDIRLCKKRKHILNRDITLISNNCTGGTMYRDMRLQFLSPTINLYFGNGGNDFLIFVNHLKEYIKHGYFKPALITEKRKGFENSPVAFLCSKNLPCLEIHFLHYSSLSEAISKWNERCKRVNFNKIYLIIELKEDNELELIDEYVQLNYPKVIFNPVCNIAPCFCPTFYSKFGTGEDAPVLKLVSFFGKRGYDSYDFISHVFNYNFGVKKR